MSCTEIYSFNNDGNTEYIADVENSWRGAMAIWSYLEKKYLQPYIPNYVKCCNWYRSEMTSEEIFERIGFEPSRFSSFSEDNPMKEVWNLADNTDIPEYERIVLFTTFDKFLVKKEDIPKVIVTFRKFEAETSLQEQADILEELFHCVRRCKTARRSQAQRFLMACIMSSLIMVIRKKCIWTHIRSGKINVSRSSRSSKIGI